MKKRYLVLILVFFVVVVGLAYLFRPMTMNDIYDEPNFQGTVVETDETSMLVAVAPEEQESKSSDLISVSLKVQLKDSMTQFAQGDRVKVYYNGEIAESYPAQVHTVYAILLLEPASPSSTKADQ